MTTEQLIIPDTAVRIIGVTDFGRSKLGVFFINNNTTGRFFVQLFGASQPRPDIAGGLHYIGPRFTVAAGSPKALRVGPDEWMPYLGLEIQREIAISSPSGQIFSVEVYQFVEGGENARK